MKLKNNLILTVIIIVFNTGLIAEERNIFEEAAYGNLERIKYLIESGTNVNIKNYNESTLLETAVLFGKFHVVKYLISKGADPNLRDYYGKTALYDAIHLYNGQSSYEITDFLYNHGANIKIKNKFGDTLLHSLSDKDFFKNSNLEIAKYLIEKGAPFDTANNSDETPLYIIFNKGKLSKEKLELAKLLIQNGARVNYTTKYKYTPLHEAVRYENIEAIKLLLQNKADVHINNDKGINPLQYAIKYESDEEVIDCIKKYGMNLTSEDNNQIAMYKSKSNSARTGERLKTTREHALLLAIPFIYTGLTIYFRESRYKDNPADNPMGNFNSVVTGGAIGFLGGALIGASVAINTFTGVEGGFSVAIGRIYTGKLYMLIGGIAGGVAGGIIGFHNRESFKNNRGLYYSAPVASILIPLIIYHF
ncbi:MAG: ankyrin repeat domain-containing protein [Spirochaetota bacterium]